MCGIVEWDRLVPSRLYSRVGMAMAWFRVAFDFGCGGDDHGYCVGSVEISG
ncbi:hypothetical protein KC19_11G038900 [Ceratodon purpureus]|uniref:Uncharacterized protein n=1 Tax=Ceratodon purpureus TaxID=3225 RepID=A0A8T0GA74_CERPU|nr:hypothetical protein KC19_11G038900 [Ceratodon purpureus]